MATRSMTKEPKEGKARGRQKGLVTGQDEEEIALETDIVLVTQHQPASEALTNETDPLFEAALDRIAKGIAAEKAAMDALLQRLRRPAER
jgi:hypothetical protein